MVIAYIFVLIFLIVLKDKPVLGLPKENTNAIKGILALFIIAHHCSQIYTADVPIINWFKDSGGWICAIFFFISGYGMYSQEAKISSMSFYEFWKKRLSKVIKPFLLIAIGYQLIIHLTYTEQFNYTQILTRLAKGNVEEILPYCWFIFALVYLYIITYLTAGKRLGLISLIGLILAYIICMRYILHWGTWWYTSIFAYALGAICKKRLELSIKVWRYIAISTVILVSVYLFTDYKNDILHIFCLLLVTFVLIYASANMPQWCYKYTPYSISYEMYLFQGYSTFIFYKNYDGPFIVYLLLVIGTTLILSICYKKITKLLTLK